MSGIIRTIRPGDFIVAKTHEAFGNCGTVTKVSDTFIHFIHPMIKWRQTIRRERWWELYERLDPRQAARYHSKWLTQITGTRTGTETFPNSRVSSDGRHPRRTRDVRTSEGRMYSC